MNKLDNYLPGILTAIFLIILIVAIRYGNSNPKIGEANCPCCGTRLCIMREDITDTGSDYQGKPVTTSRTEYHLERKSN